MTKSKVTIKSVRPAHVEGSATVTEFSDGRFAVEIQVCDFLGRYFSLTLPAVRNEAYEGERT